MGYRLNTPSSVENIRRSVDFIHLMQSENVHHPEGAEDINAISIFLTEREGEWLVANSHFEIWPSKIDLLDEPSLLQKMR